MNPRDAAALAWWCAEWLALSWAPGWLSGRVKSVSSSTVIAGWGTTLGRCEYYLSSAQISRSARMKRRRAKTKSLHISFIWKGEHAPWCVHTRPHTSIFVCVVPPSAHWSTHLANVSPTTPIPSLGAFSLLHNQQLIIVFAHTLCKWVFMATGITISILQQYFSRLIAKFLNCTSELLIRHDRGGEIVIFRQ